MFKKNAWIVGLLAALAIMFVGCLDAPEVDNSGVETEIAKLSSVLADAPVGKITDWSSIFAGTPFMRCGGDATFEVTADKKLKISGMKQTWGEGFDIYNNAGSEGNTGAGFKAGDVLYLKGTADLDKGFYANLKGGAYAMLWKADTEAFEKEITLTTADIGEIKSGNPQCIRLHFLDGDRKGTIIFEEITVIGKRGADDVPEVPPAYDIKGAGAYKFGVLEPAADEVYLDLNLAQVSILTPPDHIFDRQKATRGAEITADALTVKFDWNTQGVYIPFNDDQKAFIRARALLGNKFDVTIEGSATQAASHVRWGLASGTGSNWDISNLVTSNNFNPPVTTPATTTFGATLTPNLSRIDTLNGFILQARPDGAQGTTTAITVPYTVTVKSIKLKVIDGTAIDTVSFSINDPKIGVTAPTTVSGTGFTGVITWTPALPLNGKFAKSTEYYASVALSPTGGYCFAPWLNVIVNGASEVAVNGIVYISDAFPETAATIPPLAAGIIWKLSELDWVVANTAPSVGWWSARPLQFNSDGSTLTVTNHAITVPAAARDADYKGFDMYIGAQDTTSTVDFDPGTYRVEMTVKGKIIGNGTATTLKLQVQGNNNPWPTFIEKEIAVPATGNVDFEASGEIPADFNTAGQLVRIHPNQANIGFILEEITFDNKGLR